MKRKPLPVPPGCEGMEIKVQASVCTGERLIGFLDKKTGRLLNAELCPTAEDERRYLERYGM